MKQQREIVKCIMLLALAVIVLVVGVLLTPKSNNFVEEGADNSKSLTEEMPSESMAVDLLMQADLLIEEQQGIDQMLLFELESGAYTFDDPLVVLDPYKRSPLTALTLFNTNEPARITLHVPGTTKLADINFTFDSYESVHQIPIYGLYAGVENEVVITAEYKNGDKVEKVINIQTEPLSIQFKDDIILTTVVNPEQYAAHRCGW